jgi:hypothetical protein
MLLKDLDDFDTNGKTGDWCFVNGETYIAIQLGNEKFIETCMLPIVKQGESKSGVRWEWNGNKENPTLTPSILHWGHGRDKPATWYGYLTDGKLVTV